MSDNIAVAIIGGSITLAVGFLAAAVAIGVYRAGERVRREASTIEQRRLTVVRMLDTIEQAIHSRSAPSLFRLWRNPMVDLTLALPRLLLELPAEDLPVAEWAAGQVQHAAITVGVRPFVDRVMNIEGRLIAWHRGDVATAWFKEELQREPYDPHFRVPIKIRAAIWSRDLAQNFALGVAIGVGAKGAQSLLKP